MWLRLGGATVRAFPVFGSGGSSFEGTFLFSSTISQKRTVQIPVPGKRFRRFRFRFLLHGKTLPMAVVSVLVLFLSHPVFFGPLSACERESSH